jgi:hypothetical protein
MSSVATSAQCRSSITTIRALLAASASNRAASASICSFREAAGANSAPPGSSFARTSRIGPYGRPANSVHAPLPILQREFACDAQNSRIRRDLPSPAFPATNTKPPREEPASSRRSCKYDSSSRRPTNGRQSTGRTITMHSRFATLRGPPVCRVVDPPYRGSSHVDSVRACATSPSTPSMTLGPISRRADRKHR